ncbi:MAG: ABC transporter substrate-binding protein [Alphaproteobacteria bacterium]|jgi:phospholipid transport system substrate-binding protein|nr:ABC transporter substrate-binding protein [Alphaproteobacteria bacterium]
MRRRGYLGLFALALAAVFVAPPMAGSRAVAKSQDRMLLPGEATALVKALGDAAVEMLSNKQLTPREKTRRFRHLLNQSFALKGIARFALGRYWRHANLGQRRRYLKLFEDYIVNSYAARFGNYSGESFVVLDERIDDRGRAVVSTRIQRPSGEPVEVVWHLHERLGAVRIVDVTVEGISMSLTQRSDFAAAVRTAGGDLDAFLDTLEAKVRGIKFQPAKSQ